MRISKEVISRVLDLSSHQRVLFLFATLLLLANLQTAPTQAQEDVTPGGTIPDITNPLATLECSIYYDLIAAAHLEAFGEPLPELETVLSAAADTEVVSGADEHTVSTEDTTAVTEATPAQSWAHQPLGIYGIPPEQRAPILNQAYSKTVTIPLPDGPITFTYNKPVVLSSDAGVTLEAEPFISMFDKGDLAIGPNLVWYQDTSRKECAQFHTHIHEERQIELILGDPRTAFLDFEQYTQETLEMPYSMLQIQTLDIYNDAPGGYETAVIWPALLAGILEVDYAKFSLGGTTANAHLISRMETALQYAVNKGVIIVAAAGNRGIDPNYYPACAHIEHKVLMQATANYGGVFVPWINTNTACIEKTQYNFSAPGSGVPIVTQETGEQTHNTGTSYTTLQFITTAAGMQHAFPHLSDAQLLEYIYGRTAPVEQIPQLHHLSLLPNEYFGIPYKQLYLPLVLSTAQD